mgnify:CR=1 FL=1
MFKLLLTIHFVFLFFQLLSMGTLGDFFIIPLLSLTVPILCLINTIFFIFWLLRFKWPLILFLVALLIGFEEWQLLYQPEKNGIPTSEGLKVMSYNVRSFNRFKWLEETKVSSSIEYFINESKAEVICFQEYAKNEAPKFENYPYQVFKPYIENGKIGSCIISKYPLIQSKVISFKGSLNGGMQSDLIWKKDTLRIYNLHFESFRLDRNDSLISSNYSEKIRTKMKMVFEIQNQQVDQFNALSKSNYYPEIICTDLNNNAFSRAYNAIQRTRVDSFLEKGAGFGATYNFLYLPMRIDFIFTSPKLRVVDFKTHGVKLSDHKPISVKLEKS